MKKKGQSSIELMVLVLFMLVIVSLSIFVVGTLSIDLRDSQNAQERDEFANFILSEFLLAQKVRGGYQRSITVPSHFVNRFNVSFNGSYMVLQDFFAEGEDSRKHYYEIPGNVSYTYIVDVNNQGLLTINNTNEPQEDRLVLNFSNSFQISSS